MLYYKSYTLLHISILICTHMRDINKNLHFNYLRKTICPIVAVMVCMLDIQSDDLKKIH